MKYVYEALCVDVIDGDTIVVNLDLGLSIFAKKIKIRLHRINAPEKSGDTRAAGEAAEKALVELVYAKDIEVRTIKDRAGKYGRLLGEIYVNGQNVNDLMVERGHAVYASYMPPTASED